MFSDDHWFDDNDEEDDAVIFVRQDGDTEEKNVSWCRSNGFFCVEEGVWSGNWYYKYHPRNSIPAKEGHIITEAHGERYRDQHGVESITDLLQGLQYLNKRLVADLPDAELEQEYERPSKIMRKLEEKELLKIPKPPPGQTDIRSYFGGRANTEKT